MNKFVFLVLWVGAVFARNPVFLNGSLPLNQGRWILVHNAYKRLPPLVDPALQSIEAYHSWATFLESWWSVMPLLVRFIGILFVQEIEYEHPPIEHYLDAGLRAFELDLFYDDDSHHWNTILNYSNCFRRCVERIPLKNPQWEEGGMKVFHMQDVDTNAEFHTFRRYLLALKEWSDKQLRMHTPVFIVLESKDTRGTVEILEKFLPFVFLPYLSFPDNYGTLIDQEILDVFPQDSLFVPDDLKARGNMSCLSSVVQSAGWPTADELQGKFLFAFSTTRNSESLKYIGNQCLQNRVMFNLDATPNSSHASQRDAASIFKMDSPEVPDLDTFVYQGYLVITRSDADTKQARGIDMERQNTAMQSGAHFVSTDYPFPPAQLSPINSRYNHFGILFPNFNLEYRTTFSNQTNTGFWFRCNHQTVEDCPPPKPYSYRSSNPNWLWPVVIVFLVLSVGVFAFLCLVEPNSRSFTSVETESWQT